MCSIYYLRIFFLFKDRVKKQTAIECLFNAMYILIFKTKCLILKIKMQKEIFFSQLLKNDSNLWLFYIDALHSKALLLTNPRENSATAPKLGLKLMNISIFSWLANYFLDCLVNNAHHCFPEPNLTCLNCLFCSTKHSQTKIYLACYWRRLTHWFHRVRLYDVTVVFCPPDHFIPF